MSHCLGRAPRRRSWLPELQDDGAAEHRVDPCDLEHLHVMLGQDGVFTKRREQIAGDAQEEPGWRDGKFQAQACACRAVADPWGDPWIARGKQDAPSLALEA